MKLYISMLLSVFFGVLSYTSEQVALALIVYLLAMIYYKENK